MLKLKCSHSVHFSLTETNDIAPEEIRFCIVKLMCADLSVGCTSLRAVGDGLWYLALTSRGLAFLVTGQAQEEALFGLVWACSGLSLPLSLRSQGSEWIRGSASAAAALLMRTP